MELKELKDNVIFQSLYQLTFIIYVSVIFYCLTYMYTSIDKVDKHMTDMKAYVDNSTKLIIEEIRSSSGQPTQATHQ